MFQIIPVTLRNITSRVGADHTLLALQAFNAIRYTALIGVSILFAHLAEQSTIYAFESLILIGSGFTFFFVSGLGNSLLPLYRSVRSEEEQRAMFPSAFVILGIFSLVSVLLMNGYNFVMNDAELRQLTFLYSLFMLFNLLSMIAENFLLAIGKLRLLIWWGILSFGAYITIITLSLINGMDLQSIVIFLIFLGIAKLAVAIGFLHVLNGWHFSQTVTLRVLKYSAPIMLSLFIANAYIYFNSFWIREQFSEKEFNLFRYGSREFPLFVILANSFSTVQSGILAQFHEPNKLVNALSEHKKHLGRLMNQLFPVAIILILIAKPLFHFVFTEEFVPAAGIFIILMFGIQSKLLFPQSVLMAMHKTKYAMYASIVEMIAGLGLSLTLGYYMGIEGVAVAMVVAAMLDKLILIYFLKQEGIQYFHHIPVSRYLLYTIIMVLSVLLMS